MSDKPMNAPLAWLIEALEKEELTHRPLVRSRRMMRWSGALMVVLFIWSTVAPMDRVVRASGRIVPTSGAQLVQHLEGGILTSLKVHEGQLVQQGQELASLADLQAESSRDEKRSRIALLKVRVGRLEAEATDTDFARSADMPAEHWRSERNVFETRKAKLAQTERVIDEQIVQRRSEIEENLSRRNGTFNELNVARDQLKMVQGLTTRGAASQMELLDAKARMERLASQLSETNASLPRIEAALREAQNRRMETRAQFHSEARASLTDTKAELDRLFQEDKVQEDRLRRTVVLSPITGTVNRILLQTLGGVVRSGETLMEITPAQSEVLIEGNVSPNDRAELQTGLAATVRIGAYDYSSFGGLRGVLYDISPDTQANERGERLFKVKVSIPSDAVQRFGHPLSPGMSANVDVLVGRITVFQFAVRPLRNAAEQAMKDKV